MPISKEKIRGAAFFVTNPELRKTLALQNDIVSVLHALIAPEFDSITSAGSDEVEKLIEHALNAMTDKEDEEPQQEPWYISSTIDYPDGRLTISTPTITLMGEEAFEDLVEEAYLNTRYEITFESPLVRPGATIKASGVNEKDLAEVYHRTLESIREINAD